jgi:hypothetical protein
MGNAESGIILKASGSFSSIAYQVNRSGCTDCQRSARAIARASRNNLIEECTYGPPQADIN